jgi:hypothetical protein
MQLSHTLYVSGEFDDAGYLLFTVGLVRRLKVSCDQSNDCSSQVLFHLYAAAKRLEHLFSILFVPNAQSAIFLDHGYARRVLKARSPK